MRGESSKCAREQVSSATPEEEEALGLLQDEYEELAKESQRRGSKRGFKDISKWDLPREEDFEDEDEEPRSQRRRTEERPEVEMEPPNEEGTVVQQEDVASPIAGGEAVLPPAPGSSEGSTSSDSTSSDSKEEPEQEQIGIDEADLDDAARSVARNEALDGHPNPSAYAPDRLKNFRWKPYPYVASWWTPQIDDEDDQEFEQDFWQYCEESGKLRRHHRMERTGEFFPNDKRGCPIQAKMLTSWRRTVKHFEDGGRRAEQSNWRNPKSAPGPQRNWIGYTEFQVKNGVDRVKVGTALLANRGSDEVREEDIKPEDWGAWRVADGEEWSKVVGSGAVIPLSEEESLEVEKQLRECHQKDRILPSRIVRRWKPSEQPGVPPSMKSRWCIRGDKDPDLLSLDRYAPTVTTSVIAIALQAAASMGLRAAVGDLKNAFMQSDPLRRREGRLFCRLPKGGLPGLEHSQIIEIVAGAYGLGDAPAHWRKSLRKVILEMGYQQSAMDPCVFKLMGEARLHGLLIVEVDDILSLGDEVHEEKVSKLRERFKFGKFMYLDENPEGVAFNGRRLKHVNGGGIAIDMQKFVEERLHEVSLEQGRAAMKTEDATEAERNSTRAAIGALTWAAKEGRPDCAAGASLIAGCLNSLKIQDINDLNKIIRDVKKASKLSIPVQPIDPARMCWGVVTDASFANASGGASQGAYGVLCYDEDVATLGSGVGNLTWSTGRVEKFIGW